jgi:hypothetical protein
MSAVALVWSLRSLTLTSGEGAWQRSLTLSVHRLWWRYWAHGLRFGRRRARDDRRHGCDGLGPQRLRAEPVESRNIGGHGLNGGCGSGCGSLFLLSRNGGSQAELQLSLRRAEQRLVDLRLIGVEGDVGGRRVGVAFKHQLVVGFDLEEATEL